MKFESTIYETFRACARWIVASASIGLLACPIDASAATQQELEAQLHALAAEVAALKTQLAQISDAHQQVTSVAPRQSLAPVNSADTSIAPDMSASSSSGSAVAWNGYGQIDYSRPTDAASDTAATVSRFVVGMSNQFDENTR